MTKEEQLQEAIQRMIDRHKFFMVKFGFGDLIIILSQVQLALRHPNNTGKTADMARGFVEDIIATLEKKEPCLGPLLRAGFDPNEDLPTIVR